MTTIGSHVPAAAFVPAAIQSAAVDPIPANQIVVDDERLGDAEAREVLLDRAFGLGRARKTCQRLRASRHPACGLSFVARTGAGEVVGTVRLWHVDAGGVPALMLGPLAVDARYRCFGVGAKLMTAALERARALGHAAVILVGDAPYYARFGFERRHTLGLQMPGPVEAARFLGLELDAGALAAARGPVVPSGAVAFGPHRQAQRPRWRRAA